DDDSISFDVDKPGSPVLVKISYYPNWKVSGGKGPYRVSPNLMVVIPTSTHVSMHYGYTAPDILGWLITLAGVGAVVLFVRRGPVDLDPEPDETDAPAAQTQRSEPVPAGAKADKP